MLPISITGAATLWPSGVAVQTSIPGSMSVTRMSPVGVAINVAAARQIGHGGMPLAVREVTGDHAVDPNRAVDKHDRRLRPLGLGPVFERVAAVGLGERENPKPLERPIDRDLLRLIEVARGQIFVSDDGGIQLPVRADLWVERVSVRLLAAKPCDGVEIRVAEDRYADSVHDLEL